MPPLKGPEKRREPFGAPMYLPRERKDGDRKGGGGSIGEEVSRKGRPG